MPTSDNLLHLSIDATDQPEGEEKPSKDATHRIIPTIATVPSIPHGMPEDKSQTFAERGGESTLPSDDPGQSPVSVTITPSKLPMSKAVEPSKADGNAITGMSISPIPRSNMIEICL